MIAAIFPRALRAALPLAAFLLLALPTGAGAQVTNIFDFISREGSSTRIFIQVASGSTEDVTCDFASGSGFTATPGEDFDAGPFVLPTSDRGGSSFLQLNINVVDDDIVEAEENHEIVCDGVSATITISDNDEAHVTIPTDFSVDEDVTGGMAEIPVMLSNPVDRRITVDWSTRAGENLPRATAGADYTSASATVAFEAGETTATIAVPIINDDDIELTDEFFDVVLSASVSGAPRNNGVIVTRGRTKVAIASEETFAATISITPGTVDTAEQDLTMSPAATGRVLPFTARLAGPSFSGSLAVVARTIDGTAVAGDDYTLLNMNQPLTFTDSEREQQIAIRIMNDMTPECSENFRLTLEHATTAGFEPLPDGVAVATATVTIGADVGAPEDCAPSVTLAVDDAEASEAAGAIVFSVTLTGDSLVGDVTADYATSSGSAAQGTDFTETRGTLTFTTGALTQTISVDVTDDDLPEDIETFTITLSRPFGMQRVALDRAAATGTIRDDDGITVSVSDAHSTEGTPVEFEVTLSDSLPEEIVVAYATSAETGEGAAQEGIDFTAASGTLTLAAGALTQTISISTVDDDLKEGAKTFTITLTEPSGADAFPPGVELGTARATGTIADDEADAEVRTARVNAAVLPHVAQAMLSGTVSAISARIEASASSLAGKASLIQALNSGERGLEDGTADLARVLGGSSFAMSLNAAKDGRARAGDVAVWGSGDYRNLSGPDGTAIDWDGDMVSFHLGADMRVRSDLLAGAAVSHSSGSFDYTDSADSVTVAGIYESRMTGVHPYASWSPKDGAALWATVGYGQGDIELSEEGFPDRGSDTRMWSAAAGASHELLSDDRLIEGGTAKLRIKGEGALARLEVDGSKAVRPAEFDVRRARAALEGGFECRGSASRGCLAPSVEVGVRHDGGDARTGLGLELGGGLRWTDRSAGLTVEGRGRALVLDDDGHEDWGVGGLIRVDPGAAGRGLSFRLAPGFGDTASGVERLYGQDPAAPAGKARGAPAGRLETEFGYGFAAPPGTVTPYAGLSLSEGSARSYRTGVRLEAGPWLDVSLEGTRRESRAADPDHGVAARGRLSW